MQNGITTYPERFWPSSPLGRLSLDDQDRPPTKDERFVQIVHIELYRPPKHPFHDYRHWRDWQSSRHNCHSTGCFDTPVGSTLRCTLTLHTTEHAT